MKFLLSPFVLVILVTSLGGLYQGYAQSGSLHEDVPMVLSYQGVLADHYGNPVPDGEYLITMRIYDTSWGGQSLWEEPLKVNTFGGYFDAYLGLNTALDIPFDKDYWLAAELEGDVEMEPRTRLVASPYAMRAVWAEQAEGLKPGAYGAVTGLNGAEGAVTIIGGEGISVSRSGDTIRISKVASAELIPAATPGSESTIGCLPTAVAEEKRAIYHTKKESGIIKLRMGGGDLGTNPPVAGEFQDLGSITISNPYISTSSVVHVTIVDKWDEGSIPDPCTAIYVADVSNRAAGTCNVRIGMIPAVTSKSNFQRKDAIYLGYSVMNAVE